jgi:hypothetical protein
MPTAFNSIMNDDQQLTVQLTVTPRVKLPQHDITA